jgi:hypothetical protein
MAKPRSTPTVGHVRARHRRIAGRFQGRPVCASGSHCWGNCDADMSFQAQVMETAYEGNFTHLRFCAPKGCSINATMSAGDQRSIPALGDTLALGFSARDAIVLANPD